MTTDSCPYCGAPALEFHEQSRRYDCRTFVDKVTGEAFMSAECARYVRLRISQLRRMVLASWSRLEHFVCTERQELRIERFVSACLHEINRLKSIGDK